MIGREHRVGRRLQAYRSRTRPTIGDQGDTLGRRRVRKNGPILAADFDRIHLTIRASIENADAVGATGRSCERGVYETYLHLGSVSDHYSSGTGHIVKKWKRPRYDHRGRSSTCREPGSNWRPQVFQTCALPAELSRRTERPTKLIPPVGVFPLAPDPRIG